MAGRVERQSEAPNALVDPTVAPGGAQSAHLRRQPAHNILCYIRRKIEDRARTADEW
jgi:hypothetical protein